LSAVVVGQDANSRPLPAAIGIDRRLEPSGLRKHSERLLSQTEHWREVVALSFRPASVVLVKFACADDVGLLAYFEALVKKARAEFCSIWYDSLASRDFIGTREATILHETMEALECP
jgi:hypothetical protein